MSLRLWMPAVLAVLLPLLGAQTPRAGFDGARALAGVRQVVRYGPRPAGSEASRRMLDWIERELRALGWEIEADHFTASTPAGPVAMRNLIARRAGLTGRAVVVSGHTDTKRFPFRFVGANDGGSSTAILLELARALRQVTLRNDVWLVFFDGEEAVRDWSATDSLYGSRRLAERWSSDGTARRLVALINVDMAGDRDLRLLDDEGSTPALRRLLRTAAARVGQAGVVLREPGAIEDDHMPFIRAGLPAIDLIDFDYGPHNSWWHTAQDTPDKLSATSLETTGRIVMEMIALLEPGAAPR